MAALPNPKHELFASGLAQGLNATEAYEKAGFRRNRSAASRLQRDVNVRERVAELLQHVKRIEHEALAAATERLAITKERVLGELAAIGFANMGDYMRAGPDGDPVLCFANLTREQTAALAEVTVEDFKDGRGEGARDVRRIRFKLHDKRGALVDLGRHLNLFPRQVELTGKNGGPIETRRLTDLTDDELLSIASGGRGGDPEAT